MMKCALAKRFGKTKDVLQLGTAEKPARKPGQILVKVLACGLTPGDIRMLDGSTDLFRVPPKGFPYIPAGDICGVVEECDPDSKFKMGERIISRWDMMGIGGMAEYAAVEESLTFKCPEKASAVEAAAVLNSAAYAVSGVKLAKMKGGERVLVLGGGGGLGTFLVQMLRNAGASYIACTSTDEALMTSLGVDCVINYRTENWWELEQFQTAQGKFDLVVDCAEGVEAWNRRQQVLKTKHDGGRWLAFVFNRWEIAVHHYGQLVTMLGPPMMRVRWSRMTPFANPKYVMCMGGQTDETIAAACTMFSEGKIKAAIHNQKPFPFTQEGVAEAFITMEKRAGHGNVVVSIAEE